MEKIILLIRRTREYYLEDKPMSYLSERRYLWNLFFKLPYIEFKKRLAKIASLTYLANKFDRIYLWGEYEEVNKEGNIIVAIDEDDWISTSLAEELRNFDFQNKPIVKWQVLNLRCDKSPFLKQVNWDDRPTASCGYAIRSPYRIECIYRAYNIMYHVNKDAIKLDKVLSVKVDNFASISFLEGQTSDTLLKYMRKGYLVEQVALLHEYREQVDLYNELLLELYDSCKL